LSLFRFTVTSTTIEVTHQARPAQYTNWLLDLNGYDHTAHREIKRAMHAYLDNNRTATARDIAVEGPGDMWYPVFWPIHDCLDYGGDPQEVRRNAGKFLGLILWEVMLARNDEWQFTKYPKDMENEDFYVTHYYSIPRYIHAAIGERQHQNRLRHGRTSPGPEELARQLTQKWRHG